MNKHIFCTLRVCVFTSVYARMACVRAVLVCIAHREKFISIICFQAIKLFILSLKSWSAEAIVSLRCITSSCARTTRVMPRIALPRGLLLCMGRVLSFFFYEIKPNILIWFVFLCVGAFVCACLCIQVFLIIS